MKVNSFDSVWSDDGQYEITGLPQGEHVIRAYFMNDGHTVSDAVMTHIDRYGFEMMATVDSEQKPIRLAFESDVTDSDEARIELVRMVKKARKMMSN